MKTTTFGKYQPIVSERLRRRGALGVAYSRLVGFTLVPSYGRFLWFRRALLHMSRAPGRVLDAGCGCGEYSFFMAEAFPDARIRGVDLDAASVRKCELVRSRVNIRNAEFAVEDITRIDDREAWDFIYSIDVVEHIAGNHALMSRFYAALQPGGYLYIRIPAPEQDRIFPRSWVRSHEEWAEREHVGQHFDLEGLTQCLTGYGFSIVYAARTNGFFGKVAFELGHVLDERSPIAFALSVPWLKGLYWLDLLAGPKRRGNGVVVLAQRPEMGQAR